MNTAVINIKTDAKIKKQAHKVAAELGLSLSTVINGFLRYLIKTKTITFSANDEIPNEYLRGLIKRAEEDRKKGKASPVFDNAKDAINWLHRDQ